MTMEREGGIFYVYSKPTLTTRKNNTLFHVSKQLKREKTPSNRATYHLLDVVELRLFVLRERFVLPPLAI